MAKHPLAKCEECPLNTCTPIASRIKGASAFVVAAPTVSETELGADYSYSTYYKRIPARDLSIIPLISCPVPGNDLAAYTSRLSYRNSIRKRRGESKLPHPIDCCAPRFNAELAGMKNLLVHGLAPATALFDANFTDIRGALLTLEDKKVIVTYSYWQVNSSPALLDILEIDLDRFNRWCSVGLSPMQTNIASINPTPEEFKVWVAANVKDYITHDLETNGRDPLICEIELWGVGVAGSNVVFDFRSYGQRLPAILDILKDIWVNPKIWKIGQNSAYFDTLIEERYLGVEPVNQHDTMHLHKLGFNEFPHGLGFIGTQFLDTVPHKAVHKNAAEETREQFIEYNAGDLEVTSRIVPPLLARIKSTDQVAAYKFDLELTRLGRNMKRMGMRINLGRLEEVTDSYRQKRDALAKDLDEVANINWNSNNQVARFFYEDMKVPIPHTTEGGAPSVNDLALLDIAATAHDDIGSIATELRNFRTYNVILNSFLLKWFPGGELAQRRGDDYYIHANYTPTSAGGRYVSYDPNWQNVPAVLRDIFIPAPGRAFVYADMDQVEMRVLAAVAGLKTYIDMFVAGEIDPHNFTSLTMFGPVIWSMEGAPSNPRGKGEGTFAVNRTLNKNIFFATIYGARSRKVRELVRSVEVNGELRFNKLTIEQVVVMHEKLLRNLPELRVWWETNRAFWQKHGYVREHVKGRRRYMRAYDLNIGVNHEIQGTAFAYVAEKMLSLEKEFPHDVSQNLGLVNQLHDGVVYSVPEDTADKYAKRLGDRLTGPLSVKETVTLSANGKVIPAWC